MRVIILIFILLFPLLAVCSETQLTVRVTGLNPADEQLVNANLSIKCAEKEKNLNKERIESLHQIAPLEINAVLEALGYYHAKVTSKLVLTRNGYVACYDVLLNQRTLINSVIIEIQGEGSCRSELCQLRCQSKLMSGQPLIHADYETYKQALLGLALQLGYLKAVFIENEIQIDRRTNTANIILILDTGPQFFFGKVQFERQRYPDCFLRGFIPFKEGCPYTTDQILRFQSGLTESNLFERVMIQPDMENVENLEVPLRVCLNPRPKNRYTASVGYSSYIGPRATFGYERRRTQYPGHRINFDVKAAQRRNVASLRYTIPGRCPITDRIVYGLRGVEEKFDDGKYSRRGDIKATKIKKRHRWERILSLNYMSETDRILPGEPKEETHFFLPNASIVWTNIRRTEPMQTGKRASITVRGAAEFIFSSTSFLQTEMRFKQIFPFGRNTRFIFRSTLGATAVKNSNELPLSLRFFAGGDESIRGYPYKSLGPTEKDPSGGEFIVVGGRYLLVGSLELERIVYKQASIAFFVDSGNAMNHWKTKIATGVGVGFRWATPLGPLRVDIAQPIDYERQLSDTKFEKRRLRVHLTFGMDL